MMRGIYQYKNQHIKDMIKGKIKEFWRFFSLIIFPIGLILYSPIATFIDRLNGAGAEAGISFWDEMKDQHLVPLIVGITFLIVFEIGFFSVERHEIAGWYTVYTAGRIRRYTPEEVDAAANAPESEWLPNLRVILAPDIIIGLTDGIRVARYEDIELLKTRICKKRINTGAFRSVEVDVLRLHPAGEKVNELILAESFEDPELVQMELDIIRETCQKFHPDKKIRIQKLR